MANYHLSVKMISRTGGKSCMSALAYRTATELLDLKTGEVFDYRKKQFVSHVGILVPEGAPNWICEIAEECKTSRQSAIQKLSNIFEAAEKRKDSQVYREVEFSLPNELTDEQNVKWAEEFISEVCVRKGMVAVTSFHMDIDKVTGQEKPHCHALLSTRNLTDQGLSPLKNLDWNREELVHELREQCAIYQNKTLREYGFEAQVSHLSYDDRNIDIEGQPKLGSSILDMAKRGLKLDKLDNFNAVKLRNQFKILKNPELVLSIVTSNHSTFTHHDIAKVLNRYIDDPVQFQALHDRLLGSKNLVALECKEGSEQVYTTREMLKVEMGLVTRAERMEAQQTHAVSHEVIDEVISRHNEKLAEHGGLSSDQDKAIRHMLSGEQISCVVGYAGAGKTTSLEAAKEAWEASGYSVIGLAPTGKAARNIEDCGIRAMTLHKFLYAQEQGREQIFSKTVVVLDEAGMVDSRRFAELLTVVDKAGAKIIPMGDANQLQSVEAGPSFRLLTDRVKPAVLETIVRQKEEWQKDATRLFGSQQAHKALALYLENGAFKIIEEKANPVEGIALSGISPESEQSLNSRQTVDNYCLARQMSGRIWKEMVADYEKEHGKPFNVQADFKELANHQDYKLYEAWREARYRAVSELSENFNIHKTELESKGIDIKAMRQIVDSHFIAESDQQADVFLKQLDKTLRQMSYSHVVDTRQAAKEEMVTAWMRERAAMPEASHLMLAFTLKDTLNLNGKARGLMREEGVIKGQDFTYTTHRIEKDDFERDVITKEKRTFAEGDRILFTSNNTGMGVKNGTLGTILSLEQSKICVALDGKEQREVSFAPNLYPYIDNGWATNIHKSQGITVDHIKKLASFEENRNLAYVGMSRHRESLEVFGSSLDFWREEKVIDRLSRVQEKLSGFDYVNADKLEALMKEDAKVIWYEQKIQEGKDLWNAIKGTTKSAVDQLLDRPRDSITVDPLNSFEHSEEKRSSGLFKETAPEQSKQLDNVDSPALAKDSGSKEVFEDRLKAAQDKINDAYEIKTVTREKFLSFEEADKQLKERMFELATAVLGNPTSRTSTQLRFGKKGSISVFTSGSKAGLYSNHETGVYGGPLKLIEDQVGFSSPKDSLKWASEWLGGNPLVIEQRVVEKTQNIKEATWTPIVPVPREVENPSIVGDPYLNYMLKGGNKEVSRHAYRDEAGNLKGYVFRIEKADGSKFTPPLAYCENEKGFKAWKWQAFEKENKTAYGIEKLAQYPTKSILVVEGEKTADAAQKRLPEYNVLTSSGGAGNVGKTNWECLAGREVVIWPDNDIGGLKAADTLQKIAYSVNAEKGIEGSVGIVSLPHDLPEKWDLADDMPKSWTLDNLKEMIKDATPQKPLPKHYTPVETQLLSHITGAGLEKKYSPQDLETLTYLNQEMNREQNPWLNDKLLQHLTELSKENPLDCLKEWQALTGNYSFKYPKPALTKESMQQTAVEQSLIINKERIDKTDPQKQDREQVVDHDSKDILHILKTRGLRDLETAHFEERVNETYKTLLLWKGQTTSSITNEDKMFMLERAVISEALKPRIERSYHSTLGEKEAEHKALEISLTAAQLLQHNILKKSSIGWRDLIDKSKAIYDKIPHEERINQLMDRYKYEYPESSKKEHRFLVHYQIKCAFMTESKLTSQSANNILALAKEWGNNFKESESVQHHLIETQRRQVELGQKVHDPAKAILKSVEENFVETSLQYKDMHRFNVQGRIHEAVKEVQQNEMNKEQKRAPLPQTQRTHERDFELEL